MSTLPQLDSVQGARRTGWLSLHLYLHWTPESVDRFLTGRLAPILDAAVADGHASGWFYLRYWEGGPHLRIRLRDPGLVDDLAERIAEAVEAEPYPVLPLTAAGYRETLGGQAASSGTAWQPHGTVVEVPYEPEIPRYGGAEAMPVAEDVFVASSQVAVAAVRQIPDRAKRLALAADLARATATALGYDPVRATSWLRTQVASWRWMSETDLVPTVLVHQQAEAVVARQGDRLRQRWSAAPGPVVAEWSAVVADAAPRVAEASSGNAAPPPASWASQLHMLLNRLGVTPDEERSVLWMVAMALARPHGVADYFSDDAAAPDRAYLEGSKYSAALAEAQTARSMVPHPPVRVPGWAGPVRPLPGGDAPTAPLTDVLAARRSARGLIGGPLHADELGAVLWTALGSSGVTMVTGTDGGSYPIAHRPHPSTGSRHAVRARLLAFDVDTLAPATYHVDWEHRGLRWVAPVPDRESLVATSSWFAGGHAAMGLDISRLPAMLGIYVDLGYLRQIYGLRALRFACLETGHVAQNLALVAAGMGLATTTVGGFVDDAANELFCLDGVDESLLYLMPLGRTAG